MYIYAYTLHIIITCKVYDNTIRLRDSLIAPEPVAPDANDRKNNQKCKYRTGMYALGM